MGLLSTTRESLEWYPILRVFPEKLYKEYHSGLFLIGAITITDLKQNGKKSVLNAGTESGPGRGCSQMLETENLPD